MPEYAKIKTWFEKDKHITFRVSGGAWGLTCNAIHHIDLLCYITGDSSGLVMNMDNLYPEIHNSKREGYIELYGTIEGRTNSCKSFAIGSEQNNEPKTIITIQSESRICIIKEFEGKILYASLENGWNFEEMDLKPLYQSQITATLFETIMNTGKCLLPDYHTAAQEHYPMIKGFNEYLSRITGEEYKLCPIT